jgi:GNAT superfamily N-acetyltransferase
MGAAAVELAEGYRPGILGRIVEMHGVYYARAWGSGVRFEALMARQLCDFCEGYDAGRDLLLTAHADGRLVGSVAVDGSQAERPGARLRWFLLEEGYQGRGIGRALLRGALDFCAGRGFDNVYLWTVEGLPQSRHLYEQSGFRVVERFPDAEYGVDHMKIRMELPLR